MTSLAEKLPKSGQLYGESKPGSLGAGCLRQPFLAIKANPLLIQIGFEAAAGEADLRSSHLLHVAALRNLGFREEVQVVTGSSSKNLGG